MTGLETRGGKRIEDKRRGKERRANEWSGEASDSLERPIIPCC